MLNAGLGWLAAADATTLTSAEQAECLRGLEQAQSRHTAARSKVMAAFAAGGGHEGDGHPTVRSWLVWQTRLTKGAAAGAVGWMRRLAAHPGVAQALAGGVISQSWAREICTWTDLLPEAVRGDADTILLTAAGAGADLKGLSDLAEQIRERTATPDQDNNDGFTDRYLSLSATFGGAGVLRGELTPQCAAAVQAVLDSLGKRAGPEDLRTAGQRRHDAVEEACRRLIAAGGLPERAGQPTQIMLHLTLDQLRRQPGAAAAEAAWAGAQAGPGYDCDATIIPIVCGRVDADILDQLTHDLLTTLNHSQHTSHSRDSQGQDARQRWLDVAAAGSGPGTPGRPGSGRIPASNDGKAGADPQRRQLTERSIRQMLAGRAADLLSGPGGLAAYLRNGISDRLIATVSLPLDVGAAAEIIPAHLRRAVTARDQHCRFPGCDQPVAACQPHHIIPRSQGGPTSLTNMMLLCSFHHLIAVHRWGWGIALHPDGTVTATSPDKTRILHSHGPPTQAA
jgi:hypothetical protein